MRLLVAALVSLIAIASARAWSIEDLNRQIDQTNVVVNKNCAGTLISVKQRLILTNHHCIDDKVETIDRELVGEGGVVKKVKARRYADVPIDQHQYRDGARVASTNYVSDIVVEDQKVDLAVLRIRGSIPHTYAAPLLPEGAVIVRGERVWIVGNPLGQDVTLGRGIVSHTARNAQVPWTNNEVLPLIQHSAGSTGGNSGGALYNDQGQLIGVPAASFRSAPHLGYAIPVATVRAFLREHCLASVFDSAADDDACRRKRARQVRDAGRD